MALPNIFVTPSGKPYMIDNGLSFGKDNAYKSYKQWTNNQNHLAEVIGPGEKLERSHIEGILKNESEILAIVAKKGLDSERVKTRIDALRNAKS